MSGLKLRIGIYENESPRRDKGKRWPWASSNVNENISIQYLLVDEYVYLLAIQDPDADNVILGKAKPQDSVGRRGFIIIRNNDNSINAFKVRK